MVQILYAADHQDRGIALAGVIGGSQHGLISTVPSKKIGLDTLIFWGHGTFATMCDLDPHAMGKLIRKWKDLNSDIKTVEIITCNARHTAAGYDSYVKALKTDLKAGVLSSSRNLKVKALPVNVGGSLGGFSILLVHAPNKSWCYVTASGADDKDMMGGANRVKAESKNLGYDLAQAANNISKDGARKFTLNYGYFNTLRANLVEV